MPAFETACRLVREAVAQRDIPCAALAVGCKDILYTKEAWGQLSWPDGPQADEHTLFDLASLTKVFSTTMIALHGLECGLLTLDDTLNRFLSAPEDKKEITLRQLLTHTGGIAAHIMLRDVVARPSQAITCIMQAPLAAVPGKQVIYSCMGYLLLGAVLENVFGKPLDVLARGMVFSPLGMEHTTYRPAGSNIAATETDPETGKALHGVVHDENARFLGGAAANAGLFSDIGDCARFASMLASGGMFEGKPYLSSATLHAAVKNYTPGMEQHRGLGFHLGGTEGNYLGDLFPASSFGHTGFTGTSIAVDPETGLYVVLLTNRVHPTRENTKLFRLRRIVHNAVYAEFSKMAN